ncbi:MAG: hypothetical protein FWH14_07350 [Oscillospiraceae bacterium]|nr:hypothetical protein [Oscillospiraceae bacterium]
MTALGHPWLRQILRFQAPALFGKEGAAAAAGVFLHQGLVFYKSLCYAV